MEEEQVAEAVNPVDQAFSELANLIGNERQETERRLDALIMRISELEQRVSCLEGMSLSRT